MISESLIITIVLTATGLLGYAFKLCFVSKCNVIRCGPLEIHRQTNEELQTAPEMTPSQTSTQTPAQTLPQHIP